MIRLLGLCVAILLLLAGIGYYRGWFHAGTVDANGQHTVTISVEKEKFEKDKAAAEQRLRDLQNK